MDTPNKSHVVAVTGHGYRRSVAKVDIPGVDVPTITAPPVAVYGNRAPVVYYDENVGNITRGNVDAPTSELGEPIDAGKQPGVIDFDGKDFKDTQKMLDAKAKAEMLRNQMTTIKTERASLANGQFCRASTTASEENTIGTPINEKSSADEIIQSHLNEFKTVADLERYLKGNVKEPKVAERINAFFVDEDGDELLLNTKGTTIKTKEQELDFKRSMLIYFKQNDEYMEKIDEEMKKMDDAVAEFNSEISSALNPLKDNILAYAAHLEEKGEPVDGDDAVTISKKRELRKKAKMIRSGYTLENIIELVEKTPSIIQNSLKDFRNESKIKDIGERYGRKLKTAGISLTLFNLLSNDIADSLEYRVLAPGEYPEGLEGFTVFFIIRSLSMSLPNKDEETFHAAVQVAFSALLKGDLDPDVEASMKEAIKKFLSYFA